MAIGAAVTVYTKSPTKGAVAGVTVGVLKELTDRSEKSAKDAVATALGAIAGAYVTGLIVVPGAVWYRWEW
jgi:hypothetical protein